MMLAVEEKCVDSPALQDARSDAELIAAINAGDALAFEVLYHRHKDWVVNLAFRFTRDRELALDVLQETFLYFLKKFPGFQLTAQLKTFLYPAVRNLAIVACRKAKRCQSSESDLDDLEALPAPPFTPGSAPDSLSALLSRLPDKKREVLLLRFVDGFSLEEISAALSIPLGTVKSRLFNALETLRQNPATKNFFQQ